MCVVLSRDAVHLLRLQRWRESNLIFGAKPSQLQLHVSARTTLNIDPLKG
jgi:hypothetical protein